MRIAAALWQAAAALGEAGIEDGAREARLLMVQALGLPDRAIPDREAAAPEAFWLLLARRCRREPMALIRGRQGFWTLDLEVSRDTLIPRADSEAVVHAALRALPDRGGAWRVLDLGAGSGALLLAVLAEYPAALGVGVDLSPAACALAVRNAARNGLSERALWSCGDWARALAGPFDLVLANPPYIETADLAGLMPEVGRHEPMRALDGGRDGLAAYRAIVADLPRLLAPGAVAVLELGQGQAAAVAALAAATGLAVLDRERDLGGIVRAIVLDAANS